MTKLYQPEFTDEKQTCSYLVCLCLPFPNDKKNQRVVYFNMAILKQDTADSHWAQWPVFDSQPQGAQALGQALWEDQWVSQAMHSNPVLKLHRVMLKWSVTGNNLKCWKLPEQAKM